MAAIDTAGTSAEASRRPWQPLPSLRPASECPELGTKQRFIQTGSATMHAVEAGTGPPLVFMHALGWDHRQWSHEIVRYRDRYRVIAADTRGHGASSKSAGPYTLPGFADDWQAMLDGLNVERACLVGFSLGGMIAQYMAIKHPKRVAALVLVSTVCHFDPEVRAAMENRIAVNRELGALAAAEAVAKSLFTEQFRQSEAQFLEKFYAWRLMQSQQCIVDSIRATFDLDTCQRLSSLKMPCMVVVGDKDAATPPQAVRDLTRHLAHATMEVVTAAGHMLTIERPQEFARILDGFLVRHYPGNTH
jgi:3-oxoadipate enol-lactonase